MSTGHQSVKHDVDPSPPEYSYFPPNRYTLQAAVDSVPSEFRIGLRTGSALVSAPSVIAHLRLLGAFHLLEHSISAHQESVESPDPSNPPAVVRWRVFIHQAVWRFEIWLKRVIKPRGINGGELKHEEIPPLDVILAWHAYLLNPRVYADDTKRVFPELAALKGLPLERIAAQINPTTMKFEATPAQIAFWTRKTLAPSEPLSLSLSSRDELAVECPRCPGPPVQVPWLCKPTLGEDGHAKGSGWCQNDFNARCTSCGFNITRESIAVGGFAADIAVALENQNAILPGTLYDPRKGTLAPDIAQRVTALLLQPFVNMTATQPRIGQFLEWSYSKIEENVVEARNTLMIASLALRTWPKKAEPKHGLPFRGKEELRSRILEARKSIGIHVRRNWRSVIGPRVAKMLASYKNNPTPFSTDLVGAIIRQTSFTSKAFKLGWVDPLNPNPPIAQSIIRYHNFLHLLSISHEFLVPTLDIDLSWHTHQLAGERYMTDTMQCVGRYVDHDDRVEEGVLSNGFDTTSRVWERTFNTPYSSCDYTHRSDTFSKIKRASELILSPERSTASPDAEDTDSNTYPSEHPNTVVIKDKAIAARRRRRERARAKDQSPITDDVPFVRSVHGLESVGRSPASGAVTFGALGLAGWALVGEVDQSLLDAKTMDKGQCCAGYGMPYYGGPLWVGVGFTPTGGCAAGGCSAGACAGGGGGGGGCGGGCGG